MRLFVIEAYGGKGLTNGPIAHFTVSAATVEEAIEFVRRSGGAERFARIDVVQEGDEFEGDEQGIIEYGSGAYPRPV
jgi:hypothetical protein